MTEYDLTQSTYGDGPGPYGSWPAAHRVDYIGDEIAAPVSAWSFRKWKAAATVCCRVRRDSDNAETDIGFKGGLVDRAAVQAFLDADEATAAYVVTLYDQVGANDLTQATAGNQPEFKPDGGANGLPGCEFTGTQYLSVAALAQSQPFEIGAVCKFGSSAAGRRLLSKDNATHYTLAIDALASNDWLRMYAGASLYVTTNVDGQLGCVSAQFDGANGVLRWNGAESAAGNVNPNAMQSVRLGNAEGSGGSPLLGELHEAALWGALLSGADRTAYEADAQSFWRV